MNEFGEHMMGLIEEVALSLSCLLFFCVLNSVANPNPDPYVFGPPGSGFISPRPNPDPSIIKHK